MRWMARSRHASHLASRSYSGGIPDLGGGDEVAGAGGVEVGVAFSDPLLGGSGRAPRQSWAGAATTPQLRASAPTPPLPASPGAEVIKERRRHEVRDEDVVASGRIHLVARSEKAAPAWIWPASTRRCRGNT